MTKTTTYAILLATFTAGAVYAMSDNAAQLDVNGDGVLTIDEVQAAFPDVTTDGFTAMDLNADGALDESEISAAEDSGLMPVKPTDG